MQPRDYDNIATDETNFRSLLDRAIEIYSILSNSQGASNHESIDQDIGKLRRREITKLVEEISFGIISFGSEQEKVNEQNELGEKLDDAIMKAVIMKDFDFTYLMEVASNFFQYSIQEKDSRGYHFSETECEKLHELEIRLKELEILVHSENL